MISKTWIKSAALPLVLVSSLTLSGCGTTRGDRTVSGGLLGAGTGALIGSLYGNAGKGLIIGGLGGALVGAATNPNMVNLGDPPWRHSTRAASRHHKSRVAANNCTTRTTDTQRITTCSKK